MTPAIPVIDVGAAEAGDRVQLEAVHRGVPRAGGPDARAVRDGAGAAGRSFGLGTLPHLRLTVNDYPTWTYPETASEEDKLLLLEHADDSAVTVLAQQGDYEGLQVQGPGGGWIPVPVIPGALQVFSGQLLARWTGGRLRPGRHRVVAGGTVTRRSMAVFVYPDLEAVIEGVPVWDLVKGRVAAYLAEYGRPDQVAAWQEGRPYVAELADNSAGQ
jgi:hypothetical protein